MVQAILMVVLSQPFLTSGFTKFVAWGNQHVWIEPRVADIAVLSQLRSSVALARRPFRVFRFLESFHAAHVIYTSFYAPAPPVQAPSSSQATDSEQAGHPTPPSTRITGAPAEAWLDIFARTFNGMYLLLEAITLLDAVALPGGFSLFGSTWFPLLQIEAQRLWFFALVCGLGSGLVKLFKLIAPGPELAPGASYRGWGQPGEGKAESEMADWEKHRERMRRMVWARREGRRLWMGEIRTTGWRVARRCVADGVDLVVPGSVVGWVRVAPGTVGACMVVSTWLTGMEIWERCAR